MPFGTQATLLMPSGFTARGSGFRFDPSATRRLGLGLQSIIVAVLLCAQVFFRANQAAHHPPAHSHETAPLPHQSCLSDRPSLDSAHPSRRGASTLHPSRPGWHRSEDPHHARTWLQLPHASNEQLITELTDSPILRLLARPKRLVVCLQDEQMGQLEVCRCDKL